MQFRSADRSVVGHCKLLRKAPDPASKNETASVASIEVGCATRYVTARVFASTNTTDAAWASSCPWTLSCLCDGTAPRSSTQSLCSEAGTCAWIAIVRPKAKTKNAAIARPLKSGKVLEACFIPGILLQRRSETVLELSQQAGSQLAKPGYVTTLRRLFAGHGDFERNGDFSPTSNRRV